jgi:glycerol-3-phosphate dehydrogenase
MDETKILIVGGGLVGCAVAATLSRKWQDVFLVEQYPKLGMATSSRNSGVIHSGIYYPKNSLKAKHCLAGNRLTKEFCARHNVAYQTTGKLVVAKDASEEPDLLALVNNGEQNGVEGLRLIDAREIRAKEPHVHGHAALEVPSTGICAAEQLVHAFARVAGGQGANLVNRAKVIALEPKKDTVEVRLRIGDDDASEEETIAARCVVNAAGLYADEVAKMLGPRPWTIYPVRGEYCEIRGPKAEWVHGLVYPLPHHDQLSLGVHFTKTVWGTVLLGPTATYVDGKDNYERGRLGIPEFAADAQRLLPEIREEDLQLGFSGLRPKLKAPGEKGVADFVIEPDPEVPRVIHLIGIESPGLTSAASIAEQVAEMVREVNGAE